MPLQEPVPVPYHDQYLNRNEIDKFPQLLGKETSGRINQNCAYKIRCKFWEEDSWERLYSEQSFPCDYLIFDICYGKRACICDNGYSMITNNMPELEGDPLDFFKENEEV